MTERILFDKLAPIPLSKPGMNALDATAPVLVQINPDGKWKNSKPDTLDEEALKAVVQHLVNSKVIAAAQSYCSECAAEKSTSGVDPKSNFVPVIMMPIYPADQCPFDLDCEIKKINQSEGQKKTKKATKPKAKAADEESKDDGTKKKKKRGFVMQRLTDFDLLSQW